MRVLLVNQFYPPDMAPTGQHLHDLARCLVRRGHDVTVLCSRRSYDGGGEYAPSATIEGVAVRRVAASGFGRRRAGRAADYLTFHAAVLAGARDARPFDVAMSLTTPPFIGWTLGRSLGLRARVHAHWVMDLYPDVLVAHGALRSRHPACRLLRGLARGQMARTQLVVALGARMSERLRQYTAPGTRLEWTPLWGTAETRCVDTAEVARVRAARGWGERDGVLLYSGNMGLGHRLEEFLAAAARLGEAGPVWAFAGGGVRRGEVERFVTEHPSARVQLLPYVSQSDLAASLAAADVHLVSLRDEWKGLIVPSKLQAAFSLARPVVFVGPEESEPADWIRASGGGWRVAEGDVKGLLAAVGSLADPGERARRGALGRQFAGEHFDRDRNCERIAGWIEACASER